MKNTKNIKYIVNLIDVNAEDVAVRFVEGKVNAGIPITKTDLETVYNNGFTDGMIPSLKEFDETVAYVIAEMNDSKLVTEVMQFISDTMAPKKPWYKRFWSWLKKPFSKK